MKRFLKRIAAGALAAVIGVMTPFVTVKADVQVDSSRQGDIVEENGVWKNTKVIYQGGYQFWVYEYDSYGKLKKNTAYATDSWNDYSVYVSGVTEYDDRENPVKYTNYSSDGSISGYTDYEYDDEGNLTKKVAYIKNSRTGEYKRDYQEQYSYEYDRQGNMTKKSSIDSDGAVSGSTAYEYDQNGNRIKKSTINRDGSVSSYTVYEYDRNNNLSMEASYDSNGSLMKSSVYGYDGAGRIERKTLFNSDGIATGYYLYEYYDNDSVKKETLYKVDGKKDKETLYDRSGNRVSSLWSGGSENVEYNSKGYISKAVFGGDGATTLSLFYDDDGKKIKELFKDSYGEEYVEYEWQFFPVKKYIPADAGKDVPEGYCLMFRFYNPNSGEHFYTGSISEGNNIIDAGWIWEGSGWIAPEKGTPVYRLYNPNAGDHHYTTSEKERDNLLEAGWNDEGIAWHTTSEGKPLYRLYNPNAVSGAHHYTQSEKERDSLMEIGWQYEGIGWFGL